MLMRLLATRITQKACRRVGFDPYRDCCIRTVWGSDRCSTAVDNSVHAATGAPYWHPSN